MSFTPDSRLQALIEAHAEDLLQVYSRLKPFRMGFFFKANSDLHWQRRDDWLCCEMRQLAEDARQELDGIVGYTWVQEFTWCMVFIFMWCSILMPSASGCQISLSMR